MTDLLDPEEYNELRKSFAIGLHKFSEVHFTPLTKIETEVKKETKKVAYAHALAEELRALGAVTEEQALAVEKTALDPQEAAGEVKPAGTISPEQAQQSLGRLKSLNASKPTFGQVARYGALGAAAAPLAGAVSNVIRGKPSFEGIREIAAKGVGGAITGGAVPLVRSHMDRNAEIGTLRKYLSEQGGQNA